MANKQPEAKRSELEIQQGQQRHAVIGQCVLHTLGKPGELQQVQVRRLWGDHFRVNVFVGVDTASAKVAHSYFIVADDNGHIIEATPKITKQY